MMSPPSLDPAVAARAFWANNGELGICPDDVASFLSACRQDGIEVFGWELWIVDHAWGKNSNGPVPAPGLWCGGIPIKSERLPAEFSFSGDADESERQFASLDLPLQVLPDWLPLVRVNFTLGH